MNLFQLPWLMLPGKRFLQQLVHAVRNFFRRLHFVGKKFMQPHLGLALQPDHFSVPSKVTISSRCRVYGGADLLRRIACFCVSQCVDITRDQMRVQDIHDSPFTLGEIFVRPMNRHDVSRLPHRQQNAAHLKIDAQRL